MKTINIIFSSDGQSRIETRGFSGSQCRDASRFLEIALGATASEQLTAEYHKTDQHQSNHLKQEN